jgi:hypothetical protein
MLRQVTPMVLLALISVVSACRGDETEVPPENGSGAPMASAAVTLAPSQDSVVVTYPPPDITRYAYPSTTDWAAASFENMARHSSAILIARGLSVDIGFPYADFIVAHFTLPEGETPPPGNLKARVTPAADGRIGPLVSTYQFEVLDVIKSENLKPGDFIQIRQDGGVLDGILREAEDDPVMKLGPSYLLFLGPAGNGTYGSAPFGRFEVESDERLLKVSALHWTDEPTVAALDGRTLSDAKAAIQIAMGAPPQ